jgi:acyl-coenzyme A synthetase/AMP-(fatty) acid ligase
MYGAAEATARMSYLPWKNIKKKIGSVGVPIKGGKFYIEDKYKKKISLPNKIGELIYRGANVCMGYSKNFRDLSKGNENKSILRTGDLAYKDSDNFYYVVGRKDRYIKIYGMRINLQDLEEIILDFGAENICLEEKQNKILVFVKNYKKIKTLKKYLIDLTNLHASSIEIRNIKEFPLNSNYKISYNKAIRI